MTNTTQHDTILVTGATGNVGRQVTIQLAEAGLPVRAMTRRPESASMPEGVEVVRGDLADVAGLDAVLTGAAAVFLMWPFHDADLASEIIGAIARHARRVVLLSSGAVHDHLTPEQHENAVGRSHAVVERLVEASASEWTILRPSTFAANTLWWAPQIRAGDVVRGAFGAVPMVPVHEKDMAEVAVRALTEDGHHGEKYPLTGPQVLTQAEQVSVIGQALGRPVRWLELSREQERERLLSDASFPSSFVDVLLDGYAGMLDRPRPVVTATVEKLTGHPARTLLDWATDHASDFR
ncbi:NAD(P)H-binding protein [Sphaerisporangium fuscum]|uniref:NAD(P)H-binding protein n=1 Tax=Sphaerisporangium fuscum TaxID=2835868 RepID=UPI001BDCCE14|nr:NAD(P)H-binding protein [Sphaerisporangium fuscum]